MVSLLSSNLVYTVPARAGDKDKEDAAAKLKTATPIKHLVVIFDENNSFDHYFGTYPVALNPPGEPPFYADRDTPPVDGLTPTLLSRNPNQLANSDAAYNVNPFRLDPSEASTCDNDNHYTDEQTAFDSGLLDKFTVTGLTPACGAGYYDPTTQVLGMGYYDGNTVTALWNYAQHFAMSDNFFDSEFGTTVMGHLNLLSGQTHGLRVLAGTAKDTQINNGSVIANVQPYYDDCAIGSTPNIDMSTVNAIGQIVGNKNVGTLLTAANVTWGWFYDDFAATSAPGVTPATCDANYNSHYAPFGYYQATANPHHLPPSSVPAIGTNGDQANHNYNLDEFWQAEANGNLPAVSFIKFSKPNTGHPMDSTPLLEQTAIVNVVNELEGSPFWKDMAILIAYDDSDGWYDHVAAPIVNTSDDPINDSLSGSAAAKTGACGPANPAGIQDRCGFGVRLPFLVISPYAKHDYVDHSVNDTTSILRFIEANWNLGTTGDPTSFDVLASGTILGMFDFEHPDIPENRALYLNPTDGERVGSPGWR